MRLLMAKKKIVHLTYDMRIGGTETVIKNLVEGTDKSRCDAEILCIEPDLGPFGEQLIKKGYKITNLFWRGGFDVKLISAIRKFIKKNQVDTLHCHQYSPWVYGVIAAAFTRTKVIFTEHGRFYPDSSNWKRKLINPLLIAFTNHVTSISKATKQALIEYEYIPENKIKVIYNGIDPLQADISEVEQLKEQLQIPAKAKVLGTVARLDPIKNQTMMLEAFSQVIASDPTTYLIIVGDGEERDNLERTVNKLNMRENVKFVGYITKPVNYIKLMDVFLLSSLSEGTSMTLLEALSLSIPCIVTDAGGNAEVIQDGVNGLVTENNVVLAFATAINKLIKNDEQLKEFSQNSLTVFNENFTNSAMNLQYQKFYLSESN